MNVKSVAGARGGVALPSRRELLAGLAAVGASAILPGGRLPGQEPAANARRLDFHHHFASPRFLALLSSLKESGYQTWEKNYSVAKDLEAMDRAEVATSFISLTTPGISQGATRHRPRKQPQVSAGEVQSLGAALAAWRLWTPPS